MAIPALLTANVQLTELFDDLSDHGLDLVLLRHVTGHEQGIDTHRSNFLGRLFAGAFVQVGNCYVGTGLGERDGAAATDSHGPTRHQCFLAGQVEKRKVRHCALLKQAAVGSTVARPWRVSFPTVW